MYWITPNLGTASKDEKVDADEVFYLTDLNDGWNPPELIYLRAKEILVSVFQGKRIVLKCMAGISRSNGFATLILAYLSGSSWDSMYSIVREKVPIAQVNLDFRDSCIQALELLRKRLVKNCPYCNAPIEFWEETCFRCWYKHKKEEKHNEC